MPETWSDFASNSTLHGIRYVVRVSSWPRRLFWLLCLLTASAIYVLLLKQSVEEYISNPINTEISHEFPEDGMPFPLITICNLNSVMKSKTDIGNGDQRFKSLKLDLPACDRIRNVSGNLTCGQALLCANHQFGSAFISNCDNKMVETLHNALNTSSRIFDPEEFMQVYGHDIESMIVDYCRYSSDYKCSADDFKPVITPKGLCYIFKPIGLDGKASLPNVYYAGGDGALSIVLDAQADEGALGELSIGFRVVISQHDEVPNRKRGFNVYPGSHSIVGVSPKIFKRLRSPYKTNCSERDLPGYPLYSKDACVAQCFNNATIAACGCRLQGEPGFPETPVCSIQDDECRKRVKENIKSSSCSCSLPCFEINFETRVSYSKFPNRIGIPLIQKIFKLNRSEEYIRNNLLFIQIGFDEMAYQIDKQVPAYGPSQLFGDVGGNMGLMLGCSLLTVVEFIDYICVLLLTRLLVKNKATVVANQHAINTMS